MILLSDKFFKTCFKIENDILSVVIIKKQSARSQSARTYLERNLDQFPTANVEQLVEYALLALRDTLPAEDSLSKKNTTIAIVGKGTPFKVMEDDDVQPFLDRIAGVPRTGQQIGGEQQGTAEPMQL
uniref:Bm9364 n=1 Tax=Brugia malayi TaxID=6279 RepID=A0A1I9GCH8_BRUMA|nr:Bm9364 [Brugia malayi]